MSIAQRVSKISPILRFLRSNSPRHFSNGFAACAMRKLSVACSIPAPSVEIPLAGGAFDHRHVAALDRADLHRRGDLAADRRAGGGLLL
jgi:hypothetical protein